MRDGEAPMALPSSGTVPPVTMSSLDEHVEDVEERDSRDRLPSLDETEADPSNTLLISYGRDILVVDDNDTNLIAIEAALQPLGRKLVLARSGVEALARLLEQDFALIILDVAMPGMDGLEVAIHMKELERSRAIPIIFITAFGDDPQEVHRAYSAGGADYLVKPLDAEIVRKKVAVFVELSRRRDEDARRSQAAARE